MHRQGDIGPDGYAINEIGIGLVGRQGEAHEPEYRHRLM